MNEFFEGQVAIVTGASSGIGLATARALAAAGARVALIARGPEPLTRAASAHPDRMLAVSGDVASESDIERLFEATERAFGPVTVLVNNAGLTNPMTLIEMSPADWDRTFAVNVRAAFLTCRRALPSMIQARRGSIVNVASISGIPGPQKFPGFAAYCASKAALISFTESLAVEVQPHGIRANCVSPGSVDTPMLPAELVPDMTPDEVARVILFLASDASRPMNGRNVPVFGV